MKLFIVESPNKCSKIKSFLGADYKVMASVGHIKEIPKKGTNIDIKNGFEPKYEVSSKKKDVVKELKEAAKKADEIFLATDSDREGEAIAQHVYDVFDKESQKKCKRVTFIEITKKAILEALKNTRDIDHDLVNAQKARQVLDRLIGYTISPVLWYSAHINGASAGRVQSIALKILCERDKEILAFKPEDFWYVDALLQSKNGDFWARCVTKDKENRYIKEELADKDLKDFEKAIFKVSSVEKKDREVAAKPPFDTASLTTTCSSIFGWGAKKVSSLAQSLYEKGLCTYIRTDSFNISKEAIDEVRELIGKASAKHLSEKPIEYHKKSTAAAQEAHECIRPTHIYDKGEEIEDPDENKLYKIIRDRFIACQMKPMIMDEVNYEIETDKKQTLVAKGQTIKFDGWSKVYDYSKTKENELPVVEKGEKLGLKDTKKTKNSTQPPPRYKEGTLVQKMEKEGVGRPSTYASILDSLKKKEFIQLMKGQKGSLSVTDLGMRIFDYLEPNFNDFFMDLKFTADLECELDEIANGKKQYVGMIQPFYDKMTDKVKKLKSDANNPDNRDIKTTGVKCSECKNGEIVEKHGKYGKFFSCSNYPDCKTVFIKGEDDSFSIKQKTVTKSTGRKCPDCEKKGRNGELLERTNKKDNNSFLGCSKYPTCKYTEKIDG